MNIEWSTIDKITAVKVYSLLIQASCSLQRSKLGWDAEQGFAELRAFYASDNLERLDRAAMELIARREVDSSDTGSISDLEILKRFGDVNLAYLAILRIASRLKNRFRIRTRELNYLAICLNDFGILLKRSEPPTVETAKTYISAVRGATSSLDTRCWNLPQFDLARQVEIVSPPPTGHKLSIAEIVSRVGRRPASP